MVAVTAASSPSAPASKLRRQPTNLVGPTSSYLAIRYPISFFSSSARVNGSFPFRALDPQKQDQQKDSNFSAFTSSQDDLDYIWKLVGGSILLGGVIKYGSVIFPEITRPNLTLALIMIFSPVFIAVLLLANQSRK